MTPEVVAEWLRRQGHRVVRTKSSYWFDQGPRVFQAFPYHWVIQPSEAELLEFLHQENAIGLRYSTPLDAEEGSISYHVVYERPTYDLKNVDSSIRAKVRRGLESCTVGPIELERYGREGWAIERDTLSRQHRHSRRGRARWKRMVEAAADLEGFEVWGAEVDGRLAATLMFVQVDDSVDLLYHQSLREFLPLRVNNALLFETTRALVARPGIRLIHNGLHSLDAPASIDQFKVRLGYSLKPLRQRVVFHPRLAPFFGQSTSSLLEKLAGLFPEKEFIQKTEGLTRFFCNGKLPLPRQQFPEILEHERDGLCQNASEAVQPKVEASAAGAQQVRLSPANTADLDALIALHLSCFSEDEHFALMLGHPFIREAYRWFVTAPGNLVIVARLGKRIVGLTALSDRPYNLPMLRACKWTVLMGLVRRPWLIFRPDWLKRLLSPLFTRRAKPPQKVAQIAFTGISPDLQGHGIGRALKQASIQACRDWGVEVVITGVRRDNLRARAMNERVGFVEVPERSSGRLIYLRLDLTASPPVDGEGKGTAGPA